jgi:hypothetical protein
MGKIENYDNIIHEERAERETHRENKQNFHNRTFCKMLKKPVFKAPKAHQNPTTMANERRKAKGAKMK